MPDFRRSSDILDLAALDTAADDDASSIGTARSQGSARTTDPGHAMPLGYDAAQVAGYAATRLPATYAVLIKVRLRQQQVKVRAAVTTGRRD